MTKEITKARILQELQDKFALREFESAPFLFEETVVPVYNIEQHLEEWATRFVTVSVTATGPAVIYRVPAGERWTLRRYDAVFMTGAYTIAGIYTRRTQYTTDTFCYLDLGAAKSTSYHIDLINPVVLMPEDYILVNVDGYTTTGNFRLYFDYLKEELR